ncbi:MAG: diaminopimelate decarboxylase family protein [Candidatus Sericytochromatia bacterium]
MSHPIVFSERLSTQAENWVSDYGSPLYVYDAQQIQAAYAEFAAAFAYAPREIHYAAVCNLNLHLLQFLHQLGCGIHANTPGDAYAALQAGIPAAAIMYSGTNLNAEDLAFLCGHGIALNLDALDQLRDLAALGLRPPSLGLRLLIDPPDKGNRIGVSPDELPEALALCQQLDVPLSGLHMYAGTNNHAADRVWNCFEILLAASEQLPDLGYLNLGGGFGIPYQPGQKPLALQELGARVSTAMSALSQRRGRPIRLILEPGRYLIGAAGHLLLRVVSVKERGGRRFVGVDSTVGNIVVPSVYHPYHGVTALKSLQGDAPLLEIPTDLCGNTTHSRDFLGRHLRLPALEKGDLLWMQDVGAYGYAMSSHFLNRPRPAEILLPADGGPPCLIRERESLDDLLKRQVALA